jgi:hypothetical protein
LIDAFLAMTAVEWRECISVVIGYFVILSLPKGVNAWVWRSGLLPDEALLALRDL